MLVKELQSYNYRSGKDNACFVIHDDLEIENANEATDDEFRII
ncbi:17999_t:CDS:1, partial [Gigaspora rosea]